MTTVTALDSYFTSLISNLMLIERQPLTRLQAQRDNINVRSGIYLDVKSKLGDLQSALYNLRSSSYSSALQAGRSVSISDVASGYTVLTASTSSNSVTGSYTIQDIVLAKEHRVRGDQQVYLDQALGYSTGEGYLVLGGADTRSAALQESITDTVTGFSTTDVDQGKLELGKGAYYIETRNDASNGWQFRLLDSNGQAVSIRLGDSTTSSTSSWQSIPTGGGEFNTGRGLSISFGADAESYQAGVLSESSAAEVEYTAQGAHIEIESSDTLNNIAAKINEASYAANDRIVATIVDRQLVLSAGSTGTTYSLSASNIIDNGAGGTSGVLHDLGILAAGSTNFKYAAIQPASNASMTVNGISVTRSANSGLTDVISGVTLNLAADAGGRSATVTVNKDVSGARTAINNFITQFNSVQTYLEAKTAVTSTTTGDQVTYSRGALADDTVFSELRANLFSKFISEYANSGAYQSLRNIGITIDDNLTASVSDSDKLEQALSSDLDSVTALMDEVMGEFDTTLGRFTGVRSDSDYLNEAVKMFGTEVSGMNLDIKNMNGYLADKEQYLINQYGQIQAQLISLSYMQQLWSNIYGSTNRYG